MDLTLIMVVILPSCLLIHFFKFFNKSHILHLSFRVFAMEMYAKGSSFETNLTLQTHNNLRDVSFSSYLNKAEENMIRKLTNQAINNQNDQHFTLRKKPEEDEEIGVFGAEKYFKGEIEDGDRKNDGGFVENRQIEELVHSFPISQRIEKTSLHTPSIRSNVSWNSRSGLLPSKKQATRIEKGSKTRTFLASFGCNCINKKSTQISEKQFIQSKDISKPQSKMFDTNSNRLSSNFSEKCTKNDRFSFPVLNLNDLNSNSNSDSSNSTNLAGKLTLGRKLSLLNNWDVEIPTEDEMYIPTNGMYNNDNESDSSSDLFEIESFSTTGNMFLDQRKSNYAPSEVSVDWSVVTASAADFSVVSDYEEVKNSGWRNYGGNAPETEATVELKKRTGILSGCVNQKAVRVAGDEFKVTGGDPAGRRRLSESMAVGNLFRKGNNLMARFDPIIGNYGSDVYPIGIAKGGHTSQYLYVQQ